MQTVGARLPSFGADREYVFVVVLGLFIGAFIGNLAQIIPYGLTLLLAMGVSVLAWRQEGDVSIIVLMLGLFFGALFGSMGSQVPYGLTVYLGIILALMIFKTQGGGLSVQGPTSAMALILFIMVSVGIFWSGTYLDICGGTVGATVNACLSPGTSGYITAYQGCLSTCTVSSFTFLGGTPLAFLLNGDLVGFITSFITGSQSPIQIGPITNQCSIFGGALACLGINLNFWSFISGIVTAATGAILLLLGSGIGLTGSAGAATVNLGGGVTVNEPGTRTYQSLGMALLLWYAVTGFVFSGSQWFGYIGFGLGTGTGAASLAGGAIYTLFLVYYTYQAYLQGKTITE